MLFKDLKDTLIYTSLFDVSIKKDDKAVAIYVNNAIKDLQSRFSINPKVTVLDINTSVVPLPSDFNRFIDLSYSDDNSNVRFNFEELYNDVTYKLIHSYSNILVVGTPVDRPISVIYEANVTPLDLSASNLDDQEVQIPDLFTNAIILYVGYISHASMDSNIKAENNTYYMRYVAECKRLITAFSTLESNSLDTDYGTAITGI